MAKQQLPTTVDEDCYKYIRGKSINVSEYVNNLIKKDMESMNDIENINRKIKESEKIIELNEQKINDFYEKKIKLLEEAEEKAQKIKENELQKIKELKELKIKKIGEIIIKIRSRPQLAKDIKKDYKKDPKIITNFNYLRKTAKNYLEKKVLITIKKIQDYLKSLG